MHKCTNMCGLSMTEEVVTRIMQSKKCNVCAKIYDIDQIFVLK